MPENATPADLATDELYVLVGLASLDRSGETPAHCPAVEDALDDLPDPDADLIGRLSEADVSAALKRLDGVGLVRTVDPDDRSPVGKGRPEYDLGIDPEAVTAAAADRSALAVLVDAL